MIGQKQFIEKLDTLISNNKFPRFCIITGPKGSGKKLIAKYIHEQIKDSSFMTTGISVDDVRSIITNCYTVNNACNICFIPDADKMSVNAKNALLKVTEEPPNNTYIIMTLEDLNNTLDTIRSRATVFYMDNYTPYELSQYAQDTFQDNIKLYSELCDTPGDVELLYNMGSENFYNYVEKVVDNIATVSGANSFKITNQIKLKDEGEGYDLRMFLKTFIKICADRILDDPIVYTDGIKITSDYLKQLSIKGISKQSLLDLWILDIRKVWM